MIHFQKSFLWQNHQYFCFADESQEMNGLIFANRSEVKSKIDVRDNFMQNHSKRK